jgi:hypothetical protein
MSAERAALRAALVQLQAADDALPAGFRRALAFAPPTAALSSERAFRERRLGAAASSDLLGAGAAALYAGAAPVAMPADRLATGVAFSGLAAAAYAAAAGAAATTGLGRGAESNQLQRAQQREAHRANLALVGLCCADDDKRGGGGVVGGGGGGGGSGATAAAAVAAAAAPASAAEAMAVDAATA